MPSLEQEIGDILCEKGLTLGAVESATGGLVSHLITNIPDCSTYYKGSVTAYSNEIKMGVIGVKQSTLEKHGAVSAKTAEEMAAGGRKVLGVDICISDTGIAGPGGASPGKPIGLFYFGLAHGNRVYHQKHIFERDREVNKQSAAAALLSWLKDYLTNLK